MMTALDRKAIVLPPEISSLIEKRDFAGIEAFWRAQLGRMSANLATLLKVIDELQRIHAEFHAAPLLELLAEAAEREENAPARLAALRRLAPLKSDDTAVVAALEALWRASDPTHPSLQLLLDHYELPRHPNIEEALLEMETWLLFPPGQGVLAESRGMGRVRSNDTERGTIGLDFEAEKGVQMRLDAAKRLLTPMPDGHVLMRRFDDPVQFRADAEKSPGEVAAALLRSLGRPAPALEVRHHLRGIVPDVKWAKWWSSARKNKAVQATPKDVKLFHWVDPGVVAAAEAAVDPRRLTPAEALDQARARLKKRVALDAAYFQALAEHGESVHMNDPALALEIADLLGRTAPEMGMALSYSPASLLATHDPLDVLPAIRDKATREAALNTLREVRDDWASIIAALIVVEEDARTVQSMVKVLAAHAPEEHHRVVMQVLRSPRRNPRTFLFMAKYAASADEVRSQIGASTLLTVFESLNDDLFKPYRSVVKGLLDAPELTRAVYLNTSVDEARRIRTALERADIEEYRRVRLRDELLAHFPSLDVGETDVIYVSRAAADRKRGELEHLMTVDIPAVAASLGRAAALGDLKENAEYKAAREKHGQLSNRAQTISEELQRIRMIDLSGVETTRMSIGSACDLEPVEGGEMRKAAVLGPWDADVDNGVYSYLSPFGKALIGKLDGETAMLGDTEFIVRNIRRGL